MYHLAMVLPFNGRSKVSQTRFSYSHRWEKVAKHFSVEGLVSSPPVGLPIREIFFPLWAAYVEINEPLG